MEAGGGRGWARQYERTEFSKNILSQKKPLPADDSGSGDGCGGRRRLFLALRRREVFETY